MRNLFSYGMLVLLALSAFIAGYFTNDFVNPDSSFSAPLVNNDNNPKEFDIFWEAWRRLENNFIGEIPNGRQLTYNAIRGVVAGLNDPYTIFLEPVDRQHEQETLQGRFGGIGAYISRPEVGGDIFLNPIPGNPAEAAGILAGDVLVAVDGIQITSQMTVADLIEMIKGPKGTAVVLTIRHPESDESIDIEIIRGDILLPSVTHRILEEDPSIGYIQLSRFSGESPNEMHEAILDLKSQGAAKIILDLRQNGGGLLDASVKIANDFLPAGPVVYQVNQNGEQALESGDETLLLNEPVVVLVDRGTASASEILAGAMQDRDRAVLIGTSQTFGKGSVQLVFDLNDGSSVHVTSARWFTPDRNQIDQKGLQPDVLVEMTQEAIDNNIDLVFKRAVELLQAGNE